MPNIVLISRQVGRFAPTTRRHQDAARPAPTSRSGPRPFTMPAITATALAAAALGAAAIAAEATGGAAGPFDAINTAFDFRTGPTDLAERGLDTLRSGSWDVLTITGGELRMRAVQGGGDGSNAGADLTQSWRFGASPAFERLGNGLDIEVTGDFDVRGDVTLYASDITSAPSANGGGLWEFVVLYIEPTLARGGCPLSTHGGPGIDGADGQLGVETKSTIASVSVYPVANLSTTGHIRGVRVGDAVTWYWRAASSGEPLESDVGWGTALYAPTITGLSETVRVGVSHYGGPGSVLTTSARWRRLHFSAVA